jgi:hypothetical protein
VTEDGGSRAFAGPPQPVEIHHRGIWYSGELLGWRHDAEGRVLARVRCVVDRLRHSAWKDLSDLRLPDPAHPPHRAVTGPPPVGEEIDATRPHVLLPGLRSRQAKPEHVRTPPLRRGAQSENPRWEPPQRAAPESLPERQLTGDPPERRKAYLSAV